MIHLSIINSNYSTMKNFLILTCFLGFNNLMNSATLVIEGKYQNKNVFVQNAYGVNGVGFCAQEIKKFIEALRVRTSEIGNPEIGNPKSNRARSIPAGIPAGILDQSSRSAVSCA